MLPSFLAINYTFHATLCLKDLPAETQQHIKTRRIKTEEPFLLLNGNGLVDEVIIKNNSAKSIQRNNTTFHPPLSPHIELCVSPPRGEALWELTTQATEIGASSISFFRSEHNQYPKSLKNPPTERVQRVADAACEQCARPWRLQVEPKWKTLSELLSDSNFIHVIADEKTSTTNLSLKETLKIRIYLGPEGGWSASERQFFDNHKLQTLSLGPLILRVPTAAVAAIYHLRYLQVKLPK
jgi:16S rRNA (uracil1498-N3)-methyltransferase